MASKTNNLISDNFSANIISKNTLTAFFPSKIFYKNVHSIKVDHLLFFLCSHFSSLLSSTGLNLAFFQECILPSSELIKIPTPLQGPIYLIFLLKPSRLLQKRVSFPASEFILFLMINDQLMYSKPTFGSVNLWNKRT